MPKNVAKKKPAKQKKQIKTKGKKVTEELQPIEPTQKVQVSTNELIGIIKDTLEDNSATGFLYCIIGADGKVIPYAGARSVEQLLLMQKVVGLEVDRIFSSVSTPKE